MNMLYVIIGIIIVSISSFRAASYALGELKKRNYLGGISVFALALSALLLSVTQIKMH